MRIISGFKKGKKLLLPDSNITRPLKDNVKENIFNILLHTNGLKINFKNIKVIDFFSGSGSFGIECLSRGAQNVIFIENNAKIQNTLFRNLSNSFNKEKYEILKEDFFRIDKFNLVKKIKPEILFFDPPYNIENFDMIYSFINSLNKIYKKLIIVHIHKSKFLFFKNYKYNVEKIYGTSKIIFLKS